MRKPIIAGNYKMNLTPQETTSLLQQLTSEVMGEDNIQVIVCPPFTSLTVAQKVLENSNIELGGQNLHWETNGAYTGEVSGDMLRAAGCQWVICGHSERRNIFHENDDIVNKKLAAAFVAGLTPILCVGETIHERENGKTESVLAEQVTSALAGFTPEQLAGLVMANEPLWAIGTGKTATPGDANAGCSFIRSMLAKLIGDSFAVTTRILYGGSVKPHNITELMAENDVDGALVGGASLKAESFAAIVKYDG